MTLLAKTAYRCPKHGDLPTAFMQLKFIFDSEADAMDMAPMLKNGELSRTYCLACWIEMMDERVCQAVEITLPGGAA